MVAVGAREEGVRQEVREGLGEEAVEEVRAAEARATAVEEERAVEARATAEVAVEEAQAAEARAGEEAGEGARGALEAAGRWEEAVKEEAKKVISWRSSPSVRGRRKRMSVLCVLVRLTLGVV